MDIADQAHKMWFDTQAVQPKQTDWGIFFKHEWGSGGFNWLANEKELIQLFRLLHYVLYDFTEPEEDDLEAYSGFVEESELVNTLASDLEQGKTDLSAVIERFNENTVDNYWQIQWIGPFEDLLVNPAEGPSEVRMRFWEENLGTDTEDDENDQPIPKELADEFAAWLADYV